MSMSVSMSMPHVHVHTRSPCSVSMYMYKSVYVSMSMSCLCHVYAPCSWPYPVSMSVSMSMSVLLLSALFSSAQDGYENQPINMSSGCKETDNMLLQYQGPTSLWIFCKLSEYWTMDYWTNFFGFWTIGISIIRLVHYTGRR
jgi:hypothetical protein